MNNKFWKWIKESWLVIFFLFFLTSLLFKNYLFKGLLPIPSDILVGSFHPWIDEIWLGRTAGFPVKNFEICDIVYQLYPWKLFSIKEMLVGQVPLWNPYSLTGTPHLANIFTSSLYPLNFIFFLFSFSSAWGIYIFVQPFLIGLTVYLFLKNLKLTKESALFGGIVFAFSSIIMMRLEFGMVGHAALWLPLALLSVDKLFEKKSRSWLLLAVFSLSSNFLAGYLQVAIYSYLLYGIYCLYRLKEKNDFKTGLLALTAPLFAFLLSGAQTLPLIEIITGSSRLSNYGKSDFFAGQFFLPWERLITFIIPDFFGNYATWNFWGKASYYEFAGYVGIIPLFFVFYSLFNRQKNKDVLFWVFILLGSFLFLLRTPLALLPYQLKIPGFSVLVPARIIFLIDFSLAILASFGFDAFQGANESTRKKISFLSISLLIFCFTAITIILTGGFIYWPKWQENYLVIIRNFAFPLFSLVILFLLLVFYLGLREKKLRYAILIVWLFATSFNLVRHGAKYNSFVEKEVVFPRSKVTDFLIQQKETGPFRVQILNPNLFPTNTNVAYELEFINGYDSFYSERLKKLLVVANYQSTDVDLTAVKRSIFLSNHRSSLFDLMNTKYVLSLEEISHPKLKLVFQEGETRVYENIQSYSRVYLAQDFEIIKDEEKILAEMLKFGQKGEKKVILEETVELKKSNGLANPPKVEILAYQSQSVKIKTQSTQEEILVFSDAYDPGWKAFIDGKETKVYRANYNFRAVVLPVGEHLVNFVYQPLSFKIGLMISGITLICLGLLTLISARRKNVLPK